MAVVSGDNGLTDGTSRNTRAARMERGPGCVRLLGFQPGNQGEFPGELESSVHV